MDIETLAEHFELLDDWEARYGYLIDLGKQLPPIDDAERTEANKVRGCMSQVWLVEEPVGADGRHHFRGDSDAIIVKGLIAVLLAAYDGKTADEIAAVDIESDFKRLGLESHLSMNRRNGFFSMVERIQALASASDHAQLPA